VTANFLPQQLLDESRHASPDDLRQLPAGDRMAQQVPGKLDHFHELGVARERDMEALGRQRAQDGRWAVI
jgi:hypothetical protein